MSLELTGDMGALDRLEAEIPGATAAEIATAGFAIERRAKQLIVEQHVIDTGNLLNSTQTTVDGMSAEVAVSAEYAAYQEFGTHSQPARPFLGPAFTEVTGELVEKIKGRIESGR